MKIYGIKNCDTMKKAFAALEAKQIAYEFHDYKKDGVPPGKLKEWAKRVGWPKIANTRGPTWRQIPDVEKAGLDEARALALLEKYPSAIKRPVLEAGTSLIVGFDPGDYARL
jgi:arsenate reductase (glutaredoxin)